MGRMTCEGTGAPFGEYGVELLRLPLPLIPSD